MRKLLFLGGVATLGLVLFWLANASFGRSVEGELPQVEARRETLIESTVSLGIIKLKVGAEVKVGSQLSGVVAKLNVNIGQQVRQGEVLALIDDAEWRERQKVLAAELSAAIAEMDYAESELRRRERLTEVIAAVEIEERRRNLAVRRAEVERARARLAEVETQLGYTAITAPVSGTIASVSTYEGETVAASLAAPTFVTIVDLSRLELQAFVDESDIGKVAVGQEVVFRVDAFPDQELAGSVAAIFPKAQLVNNVVTYVVLIEITDRGSLLLRPEMTAHVDFVLERKDDVVAVPRRALLRQGGDDYVVVREGSAWVERPVQVGLQTPQRVEIVEGLEEGETVVADKVAWQGRQEGGR